jgi:hypothetical protein
MKPQRLLRAVPILIGLLIGIFLLANFFVGAGSSKTVVDIARSKCVEDGFQADKMLLGSYTIKNGTFGFGGTATVEFEADGRLGPDGKRKMEPLALRVELRRPTNLSSWKVFGIEHEP